MIYLFLEGLPPSANHAYFNLPRGGRALSKEGQRYKNETKTCLAREFRKELMYFEQNMRYTILVRFTFKNILNETFGKKGGAESKYKKIDLSNRLKLLEDVLKDVAGVDDSANTTLILTKRQGTEERTEILVWKPEKEDSPFDELISIQFGP